MAVSPPLYDLEATVSIAFLNRVLTALIATGKIPTAFALQSGITEGRILTDEKHEITVQLSNVKLFATADDKRDVGLAADFGGIVRMTISLATWTYQTPSGNFVDPGLNETFEIPFSGHFEAVGTVQIVENAGARHLVVFFSALQALKVQQIGDLVPGPNFTEVVRRIVERIAIVELRTTIKLPELDGLAASLPAPLHALIDAQAGQIGLVDFDVTDQAGGDIGDDLHVLFQSQQNLGLQDYDAVHSRTSDRTDLVMTVAMNWFKAIEEDFWQGQVIPRHFSDRGLPDPAGPNELVYLGINSLTTGALRVRVLFRRPVVVGSITGSVMLEVQPYMDGDFLKVRLLDEQVSFGWAREPAQGVLFFALYELWLRAIIRGIDLVLEPWIESKVKEFIEQQRIRVSLSFHWPQTGFDVSVALSELPVLEQELSGCARVSISS